MHTQGNYCRSLLSTSRLRLYLWVHGFFRRLGTLSREADNGQDTYEIEESWNFPGDLGEMLKTVEGWDPIVHAAISAIPPENVVDWKLLWRDPIRKWVSTTGQITIAGDAAHPHLPTSGSGAAQAIEDAATLGALLDTLGKDNLSTAFRAFEKLR